MKERHPMDTSTVNGNDFVRIDDHTESDFTVNANHWRRASAEDVLPGYDAFMSEQAQ